MSKFNLFASDDSLPHAAAVRPVRQSQRLSPTFLLGVGLWFMAMFAVGQLILLR